MRQDRDIESFLKVATSLAFYLLDNRKGEGQ